MASEVVAFLTKRKVKQKIWVKGWDQGGPFVEVLPRQGCFTEKKQVMQLSSLVGFAVIGLD